MNRLQLIGEEPMKKLSSSFMKYSSVLLAMIFLVSCGAIGTAAPTPDVLATVVAGTLTSMPSNPTVSVVTPEFVTFTPIVSTVTGADDSVGTRYVYTQADNVNLRVNPGRLFKVSRVLAKGSKLQALGLAPGGEWLNVLNVEGINGWVGVDFIQGGFDGPPLPIITPTDVQLITGKVVDANGEPVSGIGFALTQNSQRNDATTDDSGTFYAYLPLSVSGTWVVEHVSVSCHSNTMDANCQCLGGLCGKPDPSVLSVTLPSPAPLNFVWR
jgi:hypothetical protein